MTLKGIIIPVTLIKFVDSSLIFKKNKETDGYNALVYGFKKSVEKKSNKSKIGFFKKYNSDIYKYVKEFRVTSEDLDNLDFIL